MQMPNCIVCYLQVVVIIIILVLSLLVLYMLFLLCLDPLMSRRPKAYLEQRNEEVNLVNSWECGCFASYLKLVFSPDALTKQMQNNEMCISDISRAFFIYLYSYLISNQAKVPAGSFILLNVQLNHRKCSVSANFCAT